VAYWHGKPESRHSATDEPQVPVLTSQIPDSRLDRRCTKDRRPDHAADRRIVASVLPAVPAPTGATRPRPRRARAVAAKNQSDKGGASCRDKADLQWDGSMGSSGTPVGRPPVLRTSRRRMHERGKGVYA